MNRYKLTIEASRILAEDKVRQELEHLAKSMWATDVTAAKAAAMKEYEWLSICRYLGLRLPGPAAKKTVIYKLKQLERGQ